MTQTIVKSVDGKIVDDASWLLVRDARGLVTSFEPVAPDGRVHGAMKAEYDDRGNMVRKVSGGVVTCLEPLSEVDRHR